MDILYANDKAGEYPRSWYAASADAPGPYPAAEGDLTCDVCVVGAGFTGLSAALHLAEKGYDVVLLDAHRVGWGASGRNGGQVGTGQRLDQEELEKMVGRNTAHELWTLAQESVALTKDLAALHAPDAGFADGIIHACHRARLVPHAHHYAEKMVRDYGYNQIRPLDRDQMREMVGSTAYHGGDIDMGGGHLHPLRYAFGLARAASAKGVRIFEGSKVTDVTEAAPATVRTEKATITAGHVVLACNGYLGNLNGRVASRVMPINNFIAATEPMTAQQQESLIRGNHAVA
ncbi:MAG: FAD-binding oxidoreductase, partial [Albidovulum sp.]